MVNTNPRVFTWVVQTFVHIQLTLRSLKPWQTQALVPVVQVQAGCVVTTREGLTLVYIDLAVDSSEARPTFTFISVDLILADSAIFTRSQLTLKKSFILTISL